MENGYGKMDILTFSKYQDQVQKIKCLKYIQNIYMQLGRNICSPYISLPNINSYRHYIINHVISKSNILYVRLPKLEGIKLNISGVFTILLITSQLK